MAERRALADSPARGAPMPGAARSARRIAHLSDTHLLSHEPVLSWLHGMATRVVSVGRSLDVCGRIRKLERALSAVVAAGIDHLVVTGDLTEIGAAAQFEVLAQVLADSRIPPESVTLVPGNHDAYTSGEAWQRALEGPLRAYRATSACHEGQVVERGDVVFLPVDVTYPQPITWSAGELRPDAAQALEARFADPAFADKAIVVVQHHHPFAHSLRAWQWIDGLRGSARLMAALSRYRNVQVVHGHLHHAVDRLVGLGKSRILGAPAIVEDEAETPRVRLYELHEGRIEARGLLAA